jgi:kynurenine formamidase
LGALFFADSGGAVTVEGRSNWGRWGPEDQRGALNLLTEERVLGALRAPTAGRVYQLGAEVGRGGPIAGHHRNPTWHLAITAADPGDAGRGRAEDVLTMHTHSSTHVDGLCHVWYDGVVYGGVPASEAVSRMGTRHAGVDHLGAIIGRAAILDVSRGRALDAGDVITADDLARAADDSGIDARAADIVLVRTRWIEVHAKDPVRFADGEPGLGPDAAEWIAATDPAALGMDNFGIDPFPGPDGVAPLACHELFLRDLGVPLIESLDLTGPAADGVAEGTFIGLPLRIRKGLGSPLSPILVV